LLAAALGDTARARTTTEIATAILVLTPAARYVLLLESTPKKSHSIVENWGILTLFFHPFFP